MGPNHNSTDLQPGRASNSLLIIHSNVENTHILQPLDFDVQGLRVNYCQAADPQCLAHILRLSFPQLCPGQMFKASRYITE